MNEKNVTASQIIAEMEAVSEEIDTLKWEALFEKSNGMSLQAGDRVYIPNKHRHLFPAVPEKYATQIRFTAYLDDNIIFARKDTIMDIPV
jgi:hypothetical protein